MQVKLSLLAAALLLGTYVYAEDYVTTQFMFYDEDEETTKVVAPSLEVNLDFGADYTLNTKLSVDSLSGASPTFYDKSYDVTSGASPYRHDKSKPSAFARGDEVSADEIGYGIIDYYDIRFSGSAALTKRLESRDEMTFGIAYSNEYDYHIPELSYSYLHWLDPSKNSSIEGSFAVQKADVLVWCRENSECDTNSGASDIFNQYTYNAQITYAQVIDTKSQASLSLFGSREAGYLNNQYMNVVRNKDSRLFIENETRPNKRKAYGAKLGYARALNDKLTLHGNYRYYQDDWEIDSHTVEGELYYEYSDKLTIEGALRYYTQSSAEFYSGRSDYFTTQEYASSDERLSELSSMNYLVGIDYKTNSNINHYFMLDYYEQDNGIYAIAVILGQKYSF